METEEEKPIVLEATNGIPLSKTNGGFMLAAFRVLYRRLETECLMIYCGLSENRASVFVRIHSACVTGKVFGSDRCDCRWQIEHALDLIRNHGSGILIYLPYQEGCGNGLVKKIQLFDLTDHGVSLDEACSRKFGISKVALITNNPDKIQAALSLGFEVDRTEHYAHEHSRFSRVL